MNKSCLILLLCLFGISLSAVEIRYDILPRLNPEIPWIGDPDVSATKHKRLVELWNSIVKEYRRDASSSQYGVYQMASDDEYTSIKKQKKDQEYLITLLDQELHAVDIDWNCVHIILILMSGGMDADSRIVELARYLYKLPRPIKMNDFWALSYTQTLWVLGNIGTSDAAEMLYDALTHDFWGKDPIHSRKLSCERNTEENIDLLRQLALNRITEYPGERVIPLLEKFMKEFPLLEKTDLGAEANFRRAVEVRLKKIKTKVKQ